MSHLALESISTEQLSDFRLHGKQTAKYGILKDGVGVDLVSTLLKVIDVIFCISF